MLPLTLPLLLPVAKESPTPAWAIQGPAPWFLPGGTAAPPVASQSLGGPANSRWRRAGGAGTWRRCAVGAGGCEGRRVERARRQQGWERRTREFDRGSSRLKAPALTGGGGRPGTELRGAHCAQCARRGRSAAPAARAAIRGLCCSAAAGYKAHGLLQAPSRAVGPRERSQGAAAMAPTVGSFKKTRRPEPCFGPPTAR
jgi:hypothetical protein